MFLFPTCQVRVVRFYVCSPPPSSSSHPPPCSPPFLLFVFADILAVIFARLQHGPPDCSGQRRTSIASSRLQWAAPDLNSGLQIAVGSAGPQPGDWATPDLNRGALERSGQHRTSAARRCVRRYVRKECPKICQKIRQNYVRRYVKKGCQKYIRRNVNRNVRRYVKRNVR